MKIIIGLFSLFILTVLGTETEFGQFESDPNGYNIQESDLDEPLDDGTESQQEAAPKEEMEVSPFRAAEQSPSYDIKYISALDAHIKKVIEANFQNQPVIQLFLLWTEGSTVLRIKKMNAGNLREGSQVLQSMNIGNGRSSKTGSYLAYRPRFSGYHRTRLGAIFVNLNKLFPCAGSTQIPCRRFAIEEDGFLKGKAIIEAADFGNNFKAFGKNVDTYGIAFQGCCYLNGVNGCLPKWFHTTIACLLPRSCF